MSYLFILTDGGLRTVKEITDDDRRAVEEGDLQIVRFREAAFEQIAVEWVEPDEPEDEDDEVEDAHWETGWESI